MCAVLREEAPVVLFTLLIAPLIRCAVRGVKRGSAGRSRGCSRSLRSGRSRLAIGRGVIQGRLIIVCVDNPNMEHNKARQKRKIIPIMILVKVTVWAQVTRVTLE